MRCNGSNWAVYSPGSWDGFRNDLWAWWALWAGVIMRLEHHLVGGYVRYISPHIIIIKGFTVTLTALYVNKLLLITTFISCHCLFIYRQVVVGPRRETTRQHHHQRHVRHPLATLSAGAGSIVTSCTAPTTNTKSRRWKNSGQLRGAHLPPNLKISPIFLPRPFAFFHSLNIHN